MHILCSSPDWFEVWHEACRKDFKRLLERLAECFIKVHFQPLALGVNVSLFFCASWMAGNTFKSGFKSCFSIIKHELCFNNIFLLAYFKRKTHLA